MIKDKKMIYLDNAATTIKKPQVVIDAVVEAMTKSGNAGRGVHDASLQAGRIAWQTREKLASLFHCDNPMQIAFTANATESLNLAIKGLLQPGEHVITTASEHNSVLRPLYEMQEKGVELTILPADSAGQIDFSKIEEKIKANTKAIICTHASNVTGNVFPIEKIGEIAHKNQLSFIVDASQSAGVIPIDVDKCYIDILCFTGHKSLMGPQGTGGIFVREGLHLRPLKTGGSGVQSFSKTHPQQMPTALEAGTLNLHGIAGLGAAVGYIQEIGVEQIWQQELSLMWYFYEQVKQIPDVKVYGDFSTKNRCPIVSLNLGEIDSAELSDILYQEYGIATRAGAHCAPLLHEALGTAEQGAVRFSFSYHNTMEEVDKVIDALKEFTQDGE